MVSLVGPLNIDTPRLQWCVRGTSTGRRKTQQNTDEIVFPSKLLQENLRGSEVEQLIDFISSCAAGACAQIWTSHRL